jgi:hypothetical protein
MTQILPEGAKCARCDVPIKKFEPFVVSRFGREVQYWHKRSCLGGRKPILSAEPGDEQNSSGGVRGSLNRTSDGSDRDNIPS